MRSIGGAIGQKLFPNSSLKYIRDNLPVFLLLLPASDDSDLS